MGYIKTFRIFEKRRYIKIGEYVKLRENQGYNFLPIVKIIDGKGVFKLFAGADYYVEAFLHNINSPEIIFESKWVKTWISNDMIERKATEDEFNKQQEEIISLLNDMNKYNI